MLPYLAVYDVIWVCIWHNIVIFAGKEIVAVDGYCVPGVPMRIRRRDVAKFMLQCVVNGEWKKKHVAVGVK